MDIQETIEFGVPNQTGVGLVFLPGLFAGDWIWESTIKSLSHLGYSGAVFRQAFAELNPVGDSLRWLIQDTVEAINKLQFERLVICGNSLGGLLAFECSIALGSKVIGVVASGVPGLSDMTSNLGIQAKRSIGILDAVAVSKKLFFNHNIVSYEMINRCMPYFQKRQFVKNIIKYLVSVKRLQYQERLSSINTSVLLIWGANDQITPVDPWYVVSREQPNFVMKSIIECGHSPMIEQPDKFLYNFIEFVKELTV